MRKLRGHIVKLPGHPPRNKWQPEVGSVSGWYPNNRAKRKPIQSMICLLTLARSGRDLNEPKWFAKRVTRRRTVVQYLSISD